MWPYKAGPSRWFVGNLLAPLQLVDALRARLALVNLQAGCDVTKIYPQTAKSRRSRSLDPRFIAEGGSSNRHPALCRQRRQRDEPERKVHLVKVMNRMVRSRAMNLEHSETS